ncbi:MAG: alpha-L-rhamnosidase N-terminal domain-containing protein [Chitinophagaceae bacterium]|nr:alpha-L-rhamnosidase N-terminal domain-containing protein [Chitinophagaceae bacterium]
MIKGLKLFFLLLPLISLGPQNKTFSQELPNQSITKQGSWTASWITCPDVPQRDYGVYHFRKSVSLSAVPSKFLVHVTADNRYRLFVNGTAVSSGPARGDLYNWYYETIDIGPQLVRGNNTVAAVVWNMGVYAPVAQVSNQTGFLLQGDTKQEEIFNTNETWKVIQNKSYTPCSMDNGRRLRTYMVIGPGDHVEGAAYPWGWETAAFDDQQWLKATSITHPVQAGYGTDNLWTLSKRTIPAMEESVQRIPLVRRAEGIELGSAKFPGNNESITIPAGKKVSLLLDQTFNTIAYPQLILSKGKGSMVRLSYAEALFDASRSKGHRDSIDGKTLQGNFDEFVSDGGEKRVYRPLWLRTYRYLLVEVITREEPLIIDDLHGVFTAYPFDMKASFTCNDPSLKKIWDIGWWTARLCAGETYFDCPYYEQLQYEGDTRIQSLISLYVTGDDRLMRKAITDFYHSRVPEGLTQGRYPSNRLQVIPPFSLFWVSMIYDYWMHRPDEGFVKDKLVAVRGVLNWYEQQIDPSKNMLGPMKWWGFVDWNTQFANGVPDGATDGNSAVITLQYAYTLQQAALLFDHFNQKYEAANYRALAGKLIAGTYKQCFDETKNAMANTPEKKTFSQHAGIMAVLTGSIPKPSVKKVINTILYDTSLSQATFYYRFYLNRALKQAGMADMYYSQLKPWHNMIAIGLTTFAENPEPTRSDCHAWSSSPNYDFLATICGIMPDSPGFKKVLIKPALGELKDVNGRMPHPNGFIHVILKRSGPIGIEGTIALPPGLAGKFVWNNKEILLKEGSQRVKM